MNPLSDEFEQEMDSFLDEVMQLATERQLPLAAIVLLGVNENGNLVSNIVERCGIGTLREALAEIAADPGDTYAQRQYSNGADK